MWYVIYAYYKVGYEFYNIFPATPHDKVMNGNSSASYAFWLGIDAEKDE